MNDFGMAATPTTDLHRRIRQARQDLEWARFDADTTRARAAERTMNDLLEALSDLLTRGSASTAA